MPKLRTKDILDFMADSSKVKPNEIFPILQYLKIEFKDNYCCLTKNGLNSFVKKNIPADCSALDGTILIDEKKLFNIAESGADNVEIEVAGDRLKVRSGSYKATLATDDLAKFPANDAVPAEWSKLFVEALTAIGLGTSFIEDFSEKSNHMKSHVFCKDKSIVACDGAIAIYKQLTDPIPQMVLRKEVALAICTLQGAEYASNDSYDFFRSENILYAFSKSESKFYDLTPFGKMETEDKSFVINKDELVKFNNICIKSSTSKIVTSKFTCKSPTELELIFQDPDSGMDDLLGTVEVQDATGEFKYNPGVMNQLLRSVQPTILYFYPGKNKYYITDETRSFISLIMGVI